MGLTVKRDSLPPNAKVLFRVTDTPDDACRSGILGPLVAYNESKTGRSDHRPLVIAIDDSEGHVVGGLWGRRRTTGCSLSCCSCRIRSARVGWALS